MNKKILLDIKRYNPKDKKSYNEKFELDYKPNMNIISVLMDIQENPVNYQGEKVQPVVWDCNCLDSVCGACVMLINGAPREGCSTQVDTLLEKNNVITLAPLSKFPVVRDLVVNRDSLFDSLKKSSIWIQPSAQNEEELRTVIPKKLHEWTYPISTCMTCGCCIEACPNANDKTNFIGAQAIAQVVRMGEHPNGKEDNNFRLESLISKEGIHHCGNSHNCKRVCPKEIELTETIGKANRKATLHIIKKIVKRKI